MLCDVIIFVVVVGRTRPRSMWLVMLTMKKGVAWFPIFMVLRWTALDEPSKLRYEYIVLRWEGLRAQFSYQEHCELMASEAIN